MFGLLLSSPIILRILSILYFIGGETLSLEDSHVSLALVRHSHSSALGLSGRPLRDDLANGWYFCVDAAVEVIAL